MTERPLLPRAASALAALALAAGAPLAAQVPRPARPEIAVLPAPAAPAVRGYATQLAGPVSLATAAGTGGGINPGWLATLDVPTGRYVVSASATFSRRDFNGDQPANGTARVTCTLEGLDRVARVQFFVHPPQLEPDPRVTVPFTAAGSGSAVHLRCPWSGPFELFAENVTITAVRVDELTWR